MAAIKLGRMFIPVYCKKHCMKKKSCDIECDFICQLNANGGSKNPFSLWDAAKEFHVTSHQLRCAVRDGIINAEIIQRGSRQLAFLSKDEVIAKLDIIRSYPKKSAAEIENCKKYYRFNFEKNNILIENSSEDLCTLSKASLEFEICCDKLHIALTHGIIHIRQKNGSAKYLVSRSEIRENLKLIKKNDRIFYRLLNMNHSHKGQVQDTSVPVPVENNLCDKCQGATA